MFHRTVVLAVFTSILSLSGVAQRMAARIAEPSRENSTPQLQKATQSRSAEVPDAHISVARLRVPGKARRLYEGAITAWIRHDPRKAQHQLEKALQIDPQFPEALTLNAFMHATRQQWGYAEQSLQAAIQCDPGFAPAYVVLAGVYNAQSRFDDAQRATQQAVSTGATAWPLQYEIARSLIGKGEYERALAVTDAALRSGHAPLLRLAKAHALLGLRRYAAAVDQLRGFLHDQPSGDGSQEARDLLQRVTALSHSDGE